MRYILIVPILSVCHVCSLGFTLLLILNDGNGTGTPRSSDSEGYAFRR